MFSPLLRLVLLFGLLLRFSLGKFPLPFPALEKGSYLWEQGQDQNSVSILSCCLLHRPQRV